MISSLQSAQLPDPASVMWDDWLLLVVQIAGVILLGVYVWKTWEMASATRAAAEASRDAVDESLNARLESLAPRVLVYLDPHEVFIAYIVVENAGAGTAADVRFSFNPPLQTPDREEALTWFATPKAIIPPGTKLPHWFATWPAYLKSDLPRRYEVTVTYRGVENGRDYSIVHVLDIDSLLHRTQARRKGVHELVNVVEKTGRDLERELRDLHRAVDSERMHRLLEGHRDANLRFSLAALHSAWTLFTAAEQTEGVLLDWDGVVAYLRQEAMTALRAAQYEGIAPEQIRAIHNLTIELLKHYRFGSVGWTDGVSNAFADVERVIALGDRQE